MFYKRKHYSNKTCGGYIPLNIKLFTDEKISNRNSAGASQCIA